jgi:BirA family biotin operon repressor/biotin-[acetyl-CoA-carboxylase] ligase
MNSGSGGLRVGSGGMNLGSAHPRVAVHAGAGGRRLDPLGSVPRLGTPRVHHRTIDSTNLLARGLARAGAPHGTLVTAAQQTAGRGRQGRAWSAPAGSSVLMSVVVRDPSPLLSLAAGVAVADTAVAHGALDVTIKWPNDVWIAGAKVAGILVEGRPQERWAVLGIGLNVAVAPNEFPAELRGRAVSLGLDRDAPEVLERVLTTLVDRLQVWTSASDDAVLAAIRERDALLGRPIAWAEGTRAGSGAGIDAEGRLAVDTAAGRVLLDAGEVHLTLT